MNYPDDLPLTTTRERLLSLIQERHRWVNQDKKGFLRYRTPMLEMAKFSADHVDCTGDVVTIGKKEEISTEEQQHIKKQLQAFMPWRKGPFDVFGIDIDAEWRSERKWQRLQSHLPDLEGKVIADIGCNNGYYMFRMAAHRPRFVLGLEPSVQHYYCFKALNAMAGFSNMEIDLLGVEHMNLFPATFDVIFLMGVIYHRASPMDVLRDILSALRPGGTLIIESQAIPGEEPYALFPEKTYAKAPGSYFIPTGKCLINWLSRAGFTDIELFNSHPMTENEQRRTEWMNFESYSNYIDPQDSSKTVEGYPAPLRIFLSARKGK